MSSKKDIDEELVEEAAKAAATEAEKLEDNPTTSEEEAKSANEGETSEDLLKTISERDQLIVSMKDQIQRQMAEFDNFRKRTEQEKSTMFDAGLSKMALKVLPVIDNFERGFAMIPEDEEKSKFAEGMVMVYNQLIKILTENNIRPIEAVGKEFDPNFHNAVSHVEKEGVGSNVIVEEYEKGYMFGDTVLRHSMVVVAN